MKFWRYQAEWLNSYRNERDGILLHDVDLSWSFMLGALADSAGADMVTVEVPKEAPMQAKIAVMTLMKY